MALVGTHMGAGGENLGGGEHLLGMVPVAGLVDPTGMGDRGCGDPITAPSLRVSRSVP